MNVVPDWANRSTIIISAICMYVILYIYMYNLQINLQIQQNECPSASIV